MSVHVLFAAALALGTSTPAHQDGSAPQNAAAQDKGILVTGEKKANPNKRVCKRAVATGSVVQKVTCRTVAEWNADTERALAQKGLATQDAQWREAARLEHDLLPKENGPR